MASELTEFLLQRENAYRRFEYLLEKAEKRGMRRFDRAELIEFGRLYRLAAADLARARYVLRSPLLAEYLNELVSRAHHLIHRNRSPLLPSLLNFIAVEFPQTVRTEILPITIAAVLILGAGLVGGIAYTADPDWGQLILTQPQLRDYERSLSQGPANLATAIEEEAMPAASAFIITNNIRACVTATAGGILFGLGTIAALVFNGFLLGVIGSMFLTRGPEYNIYFWAGVLPHGVLEIPAIIIAGAAGFILARGILVPGKLSRGDALRKEGRTAMKLLGGVFILLLIAGLIEGFVTPLKVPWFPPPLKIVFAILLFASLLAYLTTAGAHPRKEQKEAQRIRTTTHFKLN